MNGKGSTTILNVGRDDFQRSHVTRVLRRAGFAVTEAATGQEALRLASQRPGLILLDGDLPDLNGFEVCRQIQAQPETVSIPVVHRSAAFIPRADQVHGLEAGVAGDRTHDVNPTELVATVRSLLRLQEAEEAQRQGEERFRQLADAMPQIVWSTRPDGDFDYFNARWYEFTGWTRGGGESWKPILHPDDVAATCDTWSRAVATGEPFQIEHRFKDRRTGGYLWHLGRGLPVRNAEGTIVKWYGTCTNIDQQKRTEEGLRAGEERLEELARAAVAINAALSVAEALQVVTDRARAIIGADRCVSGLLSVRVSGRGLQAVSPSRNTAGRRPLDDAPEGIGLGARVCRANKPVRMSRAELEADPAWQAWGDSADRRPQRGWLAAPLVGRDGRNIGLIELVDKDEGPFTASDEAVLVQLAQMASIAIENAEFYQATQEARSEAEAANRMKDQFLAMLSHELRTPLGAILGWARILRGGGAAAVLDEGLEVIERNARVQVRLIEDLLDISRIISGKLRLEVQPVDLADVITEALAAVTPAAEAKGLRVVRDFVRHGGTVAGDPARLQQVVGNLLSNAVKFTPRSGTIRVVLERVNAHAEISVSDTGEGIEPEFLPFVFDRFRQADSSPRREHGGLGLGLSIVRQLVELHGGSVRAKSQGAGRGATFTVALPVIAARAIAGPAAPLEPGETPEADWQLPERALEGIRVLVVDDESDARDLLGRILGQCGAQVRVAAAAAEALDALEDHAPHVLVSDIGMPRQDGYDLIRRVRARGKTVKEVPAVALTAFARPEDRRRALLAGYQVHVAKPVDPHELIAVVASLAGRTGPAADADSGAVRIEEAGGGHTSKI
jgi:PAS domain S-box-containing protein